ncbi:MAG TPA: hypothetical protein VKT72_08675 [Candidatus Baltobacteraceae bacterium]|nr:hypothetical protein [Candidatus Baltobacteraceae bacterium]
MKRNYNDDELERALFALDLEEPPADLRGSILAQTIYRVPASASVRPWEIWLYGAMCAALVWLLFFVLRGDAHRAVVTATDYGHQLLSAVAQPSVLFWIALGGAAAFWISQMELAPTPNGLGKQTASRRTSRG